MTLLETLICSFRPILSFFFDHRILFDLRKLETVLYKPYHVYVNIFVRMFAHIYVRRMD